ncbi:MAG: Lar family restriction alleviation protein [Caldilinea sp.]|nr:Lar family restriction alleviation protein [Caldilinea sp.]
MEDRPSAKPCPFCGSLRFVTHMMADRVYVLKCGGCPARMEIQLGEDEDRGSDDAAVRLIHAWNKRQGFPALARYAGTLTHAASTVLDGEIAQARAAYYAVAEAAGLDKIEGDSSVWTVEFIERHVKAGKLRKAILARKAELQRLLKEREAVYREIRIIERWGW